MPGPTHILAYANPTQPSTLSRARPNCYSVMPCRAKLGPAQHGPRPAHKPKPVLPSIANSHVKIIQHIKTKYKLNIKKFLIFLYLTR